MNPLNKLLFKILSRNQWKKWCKFYYGRLTAPNVFDVLEEIAETISCFKPETAQDFKACFARGTGGVDDWAIAMMIARGSKEENVKSG